MHATVPGFAVFADLYITDPYFAYILRDVQLGLKSEFLLQEGFLFRGNQICVPDSSLRLRIIEELHKEVHVGRDRTL